VDLIGDGAQHESIDDFGFSDGHLMVLQAAIDERLKGAKQDKNGDIWEQRDVLNLPFPCAPTLYNKRGKKIRNYMMRRNKKGFTWGYFWLLALKEKPRVESKRISGQKVRSFDSSSVFTDVSMRSSKRSRRSNK
jgi:hypothetical protein